MTKRARAVLGTFEELSEAEQKDIAVEIVRRSAKWKWPSLTDGEFTQAAEALFLELDKEEADENRRPRRRMGR